MATLYAEHVEILNDLIRINNDRINGYNKAIKKLKNKNPELTSLFQLFVTTSKRNIAELTNDILDFGGKAVQDNTSSGKIYQALMDVKATFTRNDMVTVIRTCEFWEGAARRAYDVALKNREEFSSDIVEVITKQKNRLKQEHDKLKIKIDSLKVSAE